MVCKFSELKNKEIVNVATGTKLGNVIDLEIDTQRCVITSLIVASEKTKKSFGFLPQKNNESVIPFDNIKLIGDDTILVEFEQSEEKSEEVVTDADFEKSNETED